MDTYSHITPFERGCIMALHEPGYSPAAIATILNRHRCTISREFKRNSDGKTCSASQARHVTIASAWPAAASARLMTRSFLPWSRTGF